MMIKDGFNHNAPIVMVGCAFSEVIITNSSSPWVNPLTAALFNNVQFDPARPGVDSHCKATECEPAPRMSFKLPVKVVVVVMMLGVVWAVHEARRGGDGIEG